MDQNVLIILCVYLTQADHLYLRLFFRCACWKLIVELILLPTSVLRAAYRLKFSTAQSFSEQTKNHPKPHKIGLWVVLSLFAFFSRIPRKLTFWELWSSTSTFKTVFQSSERWFSLIFRAFLSLGPSVVLFLNQKTGHFYEGTAWWNAEFTTSNSCSGLLYFTLA